MTKKHIIHKSRNCKSKNKFNHKSKSKSKSKSKLNKKKKTVTKYTKNKKYVNNKNKSGGALLGKGNYGCAIDSFILEGQEQDKYVTKLFIGLDRLKNYKLELKVFEMIDKIIEKDKSFDILPQKTGIGKFMVSSKNEWSIIKHINQDKTGNYINVKDINSVMEDVKQCTINIDAIQKKEQKQPTAIPVIQMNKMGNMSYQHYMKHYINTCPKNIKNNHDTSNISLNTNALSNQIMYVSSLLQEHNLIHQDIKADNYRIEANCDSDNRSIVKLLLIDIGMLIKYEVTQDSKDNTTYYIIKLNPIGKEIEIKRQKDFFTKEFIINILIKLCAHGNLMNLQPERLIIFYIYLFYYSILDSKYKQQIIEKPKNDNIKYVKTFMSLCLFEQNCEMDYKNTKYRDNIIDNITSSDLIIKNNALKELNPDNNPLLNTHYKYSILSTYNYLYKSVLRKDIDVQKKRNFIENIYSITDKYKKDFSTIFELLKYSLIQNDEKIILESPVIIGLLENYFCRGGVFTKDLYGMGMDLFIRGDPTNFTDEHIKQFIGISLLDDTGKNPTMVRGLSTEDKLLPKLFY